MYVSYYSRYAMKTPREKVLTFRPDRDTFDAMTLLRERQGVPFSEQIRRALREWLAGRPDAWPLPSLERSKGGRRRRSSRGRKTAR